MTNTTVTTESTPVNTALIPLPVNVARALTAVGGLATAASAYLAWTWTSDFPGDLTYYGAPAGVQWLTFVAGLLTLLFSLSGYSVKGLRWLASQTTAPLLISSLGGLAVTWYSLGAIAVELGGLANLTTGGTIAGVAALIPVIGALGLPKADTAPDGGGLKARLAAYTAKLDRTTPRTQVPAWQQRAIITLAIAVGLSVFTYGIDSYTETFIGFLIVVGFGAWALHAAGILERFSALTATHRGFSTVLAFAAAAVFPFTQNNDHNANLGVNILIFGTVALGLNIVVGLTGLLDLGYVAFLGVGAYAAALVSGSEYSVFSGTTFPFWAAALTGAGASLVFGVLIGAPTLRLRGDYLAIVTLGFGEIFRIAVNNLDGVSGPKITNGPAGIPGIPDLTIFGFNLGNSHAFGGFTIGRFANYFFLMLVITAIVIVIFTRAADSRIGRAWVAIREDETAATAMGINGFRVKLVAFALGASLAGLAGTVSAHVTYNVVPNPYQFAGAAPPNSAFLLAAVVLGGMGTVSGPLLGAALLYLIPEKLQFLQNYELLAFGVALVILMRFRPEGVIANKRRQLEFHEAEEPATPAEPAAPATAGV
ncbi:branched-chain amino acid ABC transporter permease [Actinacidiphila oryziradicis]|uniref:Branched-chain amino acid ABC transporter permease n=1 Tax=Actinacidiphila oryziradicis TaxID=2571141 RepID=A0A4U0SR30_9ACTN|nr:branched-chain amino acid ABC transporter permease [Actinacidiphila oryziradicis]TKA10741.1 branched-chain amino acid ABC transporter permease [Actinacidiphila oryziradicis]